MEDEQYLRRAIALSREHMEAGAGGPFGALVVSGGKVLAEGWNEVTSALDPTAHAEVVAIRRACRAVGDFSLRGAVLYASCEPCPMCLAAAWWARRTCSGSVPWPVPAPLRMRASAPPRSQASRASSSMV